MNKTLLKFFAAGLVLLTLCLAWVVAAHIYGNNHDYDFQMQRLKKEHDVQYVARFKTGFNFSPKPSPESSALAASKMAQIREIAIRLKYEYEMANAWSDSKKALLKAEMEYDLYQGLDPFDRAPGERDALMKSTYE